MTIVLMRHGKTSLPPWPWISAGELGNWIRAYNLAGIRDGRPPDHACALARECGMLVTSDLKRSVESGLVLGQGRPVLCNELFREAELPYGAMVSPKMPPHVWALLFRALWMLGFKANGESITVFGKRAKGAAKLLTSLAHEHGSVLLVGHADQQIHCP